MYITLSTLNILSNNYCNKDFFSVCKPKDVDDKARFAKLTQWILKRVGMSDVICLQEVSIVQSGQLQALFHQNRYTFIYYHYGKPKSGFMVWGSHSPTGSVS